MTGGKDRTINLWNPHKGIKVKQYKDGHGYEVLDLRMYAAACKALPSHDHNRFCAAALRTAHGSRRAEAIGFVVQIASWCSLIVRMQMVFLWDVASGKTIARFKGHEAVGCSLAGFETLLFSAARQHVVLQSGQHRPGVGYGCCALCAFTVGSTSSCCCRWLRQDRALLGLEVCLRFQLLLAAGLGSAAVRCDPTEPETPRRACKSCPTLKTAFHRSRSPTTKSFAGTLFLPVSILMRPWRRGRDRSVDGKLRNYDLRMGKLYCDHISRELLNLPPSFMCSCSVRCRAHHQRVVVERRTVRAAQLY